MASLLALARRDAAAIVRGLPEGVQVALITAGGNAAQLSELTPDKELVAALIEATPKAFWAPTCMALWSMPAKSWVNNPAKF